ASSAIRTSFVLLKLAMKCSDRANGAYWVQYDARIAEVLSNSRQTWAISHHFPTLFDIQRPVLMPKSPILE
ncbi:MAG: hypothetical protein ACSHW1_19670, partial [Yoonia sp.]|uniref:hypothetical protein n=1 Tax=Yoonia sp. TaxID=2212373 RepID=UPI003EF82AC3